MLRRTSKEIEKMVLLMGHIDVLRFCCYFYRTDRPARVSPNSREKYWSRSKSHDLRNVEEVLRGQRTARFEMESEWRDIFVQKPIHDIREIIYDTRAKATAKKSELREVVRYMSG